MFNSFLMLDRANVASLYQTFGRAAIRHTTKTAIAPMHELAMSGKFAAV